MGFMKSLQGFPYSQGSWTPVLAGSTGAGTPTYTQQAGSWEKIGRLVIARFRIATSAFSSATGNLIITGLPFTAAQDGTTPTAAFLPNFAGSITFTANYTQITGAINSSNQIALQQVGSGQADAALPVAAWPAAAAATIAGVCIYHI